MKNFIITLLAASSLTLTALNAEIVEIDRIEEALPSIQQDSFVLFNIAEVLTDSELSLGSAPWRAYLKEKASYTVHDYLSWMAFLEVPHKSVETNTPQIIRDLQKQEIAVAALTSRGREEWYSTAIYGVDIQTEKVLAGMHIDFVQSSLPFVFIQMIGNPFSDHYCNGIFYANHIKKGEFLKHLLSDSGYTPGSVILIDDKRDSLENVEAAMQELGIPFKGFWYTRTKQERKDFSPMVAHVQLKALLDGQKIPSDEEAQAIISNLYMNVDPDAFFRDILSGLCFPCNKLGMR
jgi:Protein of unknown function (DUF2608)